MSILIRILRLLVVICVTSNAYAMNPVTTDEQIKTIQSAFSTATNITDKSPIAQDEPEIRTIYQLQTFLTTTAISQDIEDQTLIHNKRVNKIRVLK